jgi:hypothetical protein
VYFASNGCIATLLFNIPDEKKLRLLMGAEISPEAINYQK